MSDREPSLTEDKISILRFEDSQCYYVSIFNPIWNQDDAKAIKQQILQALFLQKPMKKFKQEIDNLMMSLDVFDHDRFTKGDESMKYQDVLAKYGLIVRQFLEDTST